MKSNLKGALFTIIKKFVILLRKILGMEFSCYSIIIINYDLKGTVKNTIQIF